MTATPGQSCPACRAGQVVYREYSAYGPFLGCSNYLIVAAILSGRILVELLGR